MPRLVWVIVGVCLATASAPDVGPSVTDRLVREDRLPEGWDMTAVAQTALREKEVSATTRILVWAIQEDGRPLYVESCVVWLRWEESGQKRWMLAHLYRHPKEGPRPRQWNLSQVDDAKQIARRQFDHAPTNPEVYQFLKETWWEFVPDKGWRLLDAEVCRGAWLEAIGQAPTKFYDERLVRDK